MFYMQKDIFMDSLAQFVKARRKATGLTQEAFAQRAGVALTVVRKIEQGKTNLNLDRVGQVLSMFGHELGIKETDKFIPYTFTAVLGNLYDRGLIDREELDGLTEEHSSGMQFNEKGLLKDHRATRVRNEIKKIMERNNLADGERPDYLGL